MKYSVGLLAMFFLLLLSAVLPPEVAFPVFGLLFVFLIIVSFRILLKWLGIKKTAERERLPWDWVRRRD